MQNRTQRPDPRHHLPVRPAAFAVLAALADGPLPGIDILEQVNATVPGRPLLGPGTLYRLMRELRQAGFIERAERGGSQSDDDRKAFHALSTFGRAVLRAEAARLRRTLKLADERSGR